MNKSNGTKDQDQEIGTNDEEDNDEKFLITCNIYDLDLKSKMKYKHWLKVENDLQEIYNSSNPNWRYCIKYDQIHH
ncbi:Inositol-pentakisphosphate 2-kinase family protein [Candida albicans]|uniref:Inositol-pentakisphosphate 2-kinase family protein n=1 Tax=Candida albicans TaxID=5476 RepID=A0A8H6C4T8_CANAX|nr:Inositol-pentakisphosphate 2-kinase family protein [Candida albicans]